MPSTPASAWSSARGSPPAKPPSMTCFTPWPRASQQAAATTSAASATATRARYGSRKRATRRRALARLNQHLEDRAPGGREAEVGERVAGETVGAALQDDELGTCPVDEALGLLPRAQKLPIARARR